MKKILAFWKKETVLCIALLLAVISSFVVVPDRAYLDYIDFRTLAILFCLMSVMAGLQKVGVFQWVAEGLLKRVQSIRALVLILVMLCFFFGMLITNDVALITFVPFTFIVLKLLGEERKKQYIIPVVVMQTIAANLGSMLTPIGNPQNLYLYGKAGLGLGEFLWLMLPYTALSLVILLVWCLLQGKGEKEALQIQFEKQTSLKGKELPLAVYMTLFLVSILVVAHIIPYPAALVIVLLTVFFLDKKVLLQVDYSLLLTFIGFFIFIGNMGRVPIFRELLQSLITGNEVMTAIVSSQVISNVPAALLLSGFTGDYAALIVGTNLGGLGTLIASMASLISYKFLAREESGRKGAYLLYFTLVNICFLVPLVILYIV